MNFEVVYNGTITVDDDSHDRESEIEAAFDATMNELLDLDGVADPSVSGPIRTGEVEIGVNVEADSLLSAVEKADVAIRTALHAAGVGTPGWHDRNESRHHIDWLAQTAGSSAEPALT